MNLRFFPKAVGLLFVAALLVFTIGITAVKADTNRCTAPATFFPGDINPNRPTDICPGGVEAAQASQTQAAIFAWKQFIALNWPADPKNRGVADPSAKFGNEQGNPLVWQTYANKVETYPNSTQTPPPFNLPPNYQYGQFTVSGTSYDRVIGACDGSPRLTKTPYVNLDEADEIGVNRMYAGVAPKDLAGQQFLFLAKSNQKEYDYVTQTTYNGLPLSQIPRNPDNIPNPLLTATADYITQNKEYPTPSAATNPDGTANYVSLPYDTIEIKTGWRQLNENEKSSFHTAPVRYYKVTNTIPDGNNPSQNQYCYYDAPVGQTPTTHTWGMGALHIIVKTPTAPYFIFATFDQVDNIVDKAGKPIEDSVGNSSLSNSAATFIPGIISQEQFIRCESNPDQDICKNFSYVENPSIVNNQPPPKIYPQVFSKQNTPPEISSVDQYLYYENIPVSGIGQYESLPQPDKPIALKRRGNLIPSTITSVNRQVQGAIAKYNKINFQGNSPSTDWQKYRLVNVQWMPLTKSVFGAEYKGSYPASYYLANDVVETDFNLQFFSGRFYPTSPVFTNLISDFKDDGSKFYNVFSKGHSFNMGGCMGCHGNAAVAGADPSFIFLGGPVSSPQAGGKEDAATGLVRAQKIAKFLK